MSHSPTHFTDEVTEVHRALGTFPRNAAGLCVDERKHQNSGLQISGPTPCLDSNEHISYSKQADGRRQNGFLNTGLLLFLNKVHVKKS